MLNKTIKKIKEYENPLFYGIIVTLLIIFIVTPSDTRPEDSKLYLRKGSNYEQNIFTNPDDAQAAKELAEIWGKPGMTREYSEKQAEDYISSRSRREKQQLKDDFEENSHVTEPESLMYDAVHNKGKDDHIPAVMTIGGMALLAVGLVKFDVVKPEGELKEKSKNTEDDLPSDE